MFRSIVLLPLALASSALATVFITSPTNASTFTAGTAASVTWQDDGNSPSLQQFGNATFAVYVGNADQQTLVQTIATYIDVATDSAVSFTPSASIGPNSGEYFIRVTSQSLKNGNYYAEAFSAKFTLSGMSGQFNSSVQAEINGQSTAPLEQPGSSATGAGAAASTTPASTASSSPATASGSSSSNGAGKPIITTGFIALCATLVGACLL